MAKLPQRLTAPLRVFLLQGCNGDDLDSAGLLQGGLVMFHIEPKNLTKLFCHSFLDMYILVLYFFKTHVTLLLVKLGSTKCNANSRDGNGSSDDKI